jgi:hypothetical protein
VLAMQSFLWCLFFSATVWFHPIHVSVTEIEMDEKDKRLEVMMRIFIDDLELTLRKRLNQPELDILSKTEKERDVLISKYLDNHFKVKLDGRLQKNNYVGHEQEDLAFIVYIEVPQVKRWKTIQIQNDVIMETHSDQSNLVHVTVRETIKSLRLTKSNPIDKLTFDF